MNSVDFIHTYTHIPSRLYFRRVRQRCTNVQPQFAGMFLGRRYTERIEKNALESETFFHVIK